MNEFIKPDESDPTVIRKHFVDKMGSRAIEFLEKEGKIHYQPDDFGVHLTLNKAGRELVVKTSVTQSLEIGVSFYFKDSRLRKIKNLIFSKLDPHNQQSFLETGDKLGKETLSYLRFLLEWVELISPKCSVSINASSQRRARIYQSATKHLPNVVIMGGTLKDTKN